MTDLTNQTINNFTLLRKIGEGGMAEVWYAENDILSKPAAVKILHKDLSNNQDIVTCFENEAKLLSKLNHPNLMQFYDYTFIAGMPCIIMEYLDGVDLKQLLKRGEGFSDTLLRTWWNQMVDALNYTHQQQIIHADINPSNLFYTRRKELKLFGWGRAISRDSIIQAQKEWLKGICNYQSPEQVKASKGINHKSDSYSLALTFYHLLTRKPPYDYDNISSFEMLTKIVEEPFALDELSIHWQKVLRPYLAKNPDQRPELSKIELV